MGGFRDEEFRKWTKPFFEQAITGQFKIVLSDITIKKLSGAPAEVRNLPSSIPDEALELVKLQERHLELSEKYVAEGALSKKYETDAQHIALATDLKVDSLVSWNFKHMVNFFRIRQYNAINLKYGYATIDIRSPKELLQ